MITSHRNAPRALLLWAASLTILGCGDGSVDGPPVDESQGSGATAPTEPQPRRIGGRLMQLPPWSEDFRRRLDPSVEEEPLEVAAVRLEASLGSWIEGLLAGGDAAGVETRGLFPATLATRFEDATTRVLRAEGDGEALDAQGLRERLDTDPWAALADGRVEVRVESIEALGSETFEARVHLRVVAHRGARSRQLNADWSCTWRADSPVPQSLRGLRHELLENESPWFQDVTLDVFGALPFWEDELALGCEDYHQRVDQRVDFFYVGILGVALGDVNGDGLEDLYLSQPGGLPNRLLLHQEDGSVIDGARAASVDFLDTTRGVLLVDLDGDGDQDLGVAREQDLVLCWNDGEGKFAERTVLPGAGRSPIYSLSAADADRDGDLDLYGCRYPSTDISGGVPTPYHDARNGVGNVYWRNDGEHAFREVAEEVGLAVEDERFSYVSIWEDLDGNGWLDLYVVNDYGANHAFLNEGGQFREAAAELGLDNPAAGMGISVADVELDGDLDLYVSNMFSSIGQRVVGREDYRSDGSSEVREHHRQHAAGNALLLRGEARFEELAEAAGCAPGGWAWGAIFHDWNADGLPDVYVPNGFITSEDRDDVEGLFWRRVIGSSPDAFGAAEPYRRGWAAVGHFSQFGTASWNGRERNYAYLNLGEGEFADASGLSRLDFEDDGRVALRLDWDGDGYLDLLLVNRSGPRLRLLRGLDRGRTLEVELAGGVTDGEAIGALVSVQRADGRTLRRRVYAGEGLLGQSTRRLVLGLGGADGLVDVSVDWAGGEQVTYEGLAAGTGWQLGPEGMSPRERPFGSSPFEGREPSPASSRGGGAPRTVLPEKLPLRGLSLPRPAGGRLELKEFAGSPILLTYYDPEVPEARAHFEGLAQAREELRQAAAKVVAVQLPGAGEIPGWMGELGFGEHALRAAANDEQVLQALLIGVLGAYRDLDLPLSLVCDTGGNLVAIHYASSSPERILRDLRKAKYMNPDDVSTTSIGGGRWLRRPRREFGELARVLQMLGARTLAAEYAELAKQR